MQSIIGASKQGNWNVDEFVNMELDVSMSGGNCFKELLRTWVRKGQHNNYLYCKITLEEKYNPGME